MISTKFGSVSKLSTFKALHNLLDERFTFNSTVIKIDMRRYFFPFKYNLHTSTLHIFHNILIINNTSIQPLDGNHLKLLGVNRLSQLFIIKFLIDISNNPNSVHIIIRNERIITLSDFFRLHNFICCFS
uniref:Uncharacterized protein n=1 Tax=Cacopsylla melanoneura TaxID=428564 RepID=A0A8D8T7Z4_9HEMI